MFCGSFEQNKRKNSKNVKGKFGGSGNVGESARRHCKCEWCQTGMYWNHNSLRCTSIRNPFYIFHFFQLLFHTEK